MKQTTIKHINLKKQIYQLNSRMQNSLAKRNKKQQNEKEPHFIRLGSKRKKMKTQIFSESIQYKENSQNVLDCFLTSQYTNQIIKKNYINKNKSRKSSLKTQVSHKKLTQYSQKKSINLQDKENNFLKCFEESVKLLNNRNSVHKSRGKSYEKNKTMSDADSKKLQKRLNKMKQYKFVQKYLSDLQLQCMFKQFQLSQIPEIRWPLLVVDQVYRLMKTQDMNPFRNRITRQK